VRRRAQRVPMSMGLDSSSRPKIVADPLKFRLTKSRGDPWRLLCEGNSREESQAEVLRWWPRQPDAAVAATYLPIRGSTEGATP
jgi:hypothetical protein